MGDPPTAEKGKSFNNQNLLIEENGRLAKQTVTSLATAARECSFQYFICHRKGKGEQLPTIPSKAQSDCRHTGKKQCSALYIVLPPSHILSLINEK